METRPKKRVDKLKLTRLRVSVLLIIVFFAGFLAGWLCRCLLAPKPTVVIEPPTVSQTPAPAPSPAPTLSEEPTEVNLAKPYPAFYDVPLTESLQEYIMLLCEQEEVPVPLIFAMIELESTFRADVISETNDYGLMQINERNHEWLSDLYDVTDFLDPYQNVLCGISMISGYLEKYEDISLGLMCYNTGEYGANQLWKKGVYSTSYSRGVLAAMSKYEEIKELRGETS